MGHPLDAKNDKYIEKSIHDLDFMFIGLNIIRHTVYPKVSEAWTQAIAAKKMNEVASLFIFEKEIYFGLC